MFADIRKKSCFIALRLIINQNFYIYFFTTIFNNDNTKSTINTKDKIFAIPADAPAIPPNPKIPAIIAMITNVNVQRNI